MKRIAIYSRKSKFTGKGDSIENQVQLCKEYASMHFGSNDTNITIYEDEGFSGGTTNRPQFQLLLQECKEKKFDVLICYRLDRISRNIADFATLIDDLQQYDISFVSIKEQFDTSTPMGRAMMYIASVFAQLERETIAERIRDNLQQLAKTGRWLGGVAPTGFESKEVTVIDNEGKTRKAYKLEVIEEEMKLVQHLFDKFIELKSITKLESYCLQNDIKSKNGSNYYNCTLRNIIENPVYCIADENICEHLKNQGHNIYVDKEDLNGVNGLMSYNKTNQDGKGDRFKNEGWTISVGAHKGIIPSDKWIAAAKIREGSKNIGYRKKFINANALLSGLLICKNCGSFMRKGGTRVNKDGSVAFYYICELKERSRKHSCNSKNIRGDKLDKKVIEELKETSSRESDVSKKIKDNEISVDVSQKKLDITIKELNDIITKNDNSISNLVKALSEGKETLATKYILDQIDNIEKENIELKEKLLLLKKDELSNKNKEKGTNLIKNILINFKDTIDNVSDEEQKALVRTVVDKVIWDGKNIDIVIFGTEV